MVRMGSPVRFRWGAPNAAHSTFGAVWRGRIPRRPRHVYIACRLARGLLPPPRARRTTVKPIPTSQLTGAVGREASLRRDSARTRPSRLIADPVDMPTVGIGRLGRWRIGVVHPPDVNAKA